MENIEHRSKEASICGGYREKNAVPYKWLKGL